MVGSSDRTMGFIPSVMKIKIPISWHYDSQEEKEVVVDIPDTVAKKVLISFLMNKDYEARQDWLKRNVPKTKLT